ncbi:uncharacterized protein LOC123314286 [Coccinella septempunctata]|uniref:uncharacterized protein LOC123314286 n=1 Tax=Coccinella septempunctata TaxID=41139 RepID=UPI001D0686C7|nr:uncharacterized protein LOC123314286 [Coccinella septempunctata]
MILKWLIFYIAIFSSLVSSRSSVQQETKHTIRNLGKNIQRIEETSQELTENIENTKITFEEFISEILRTCSQSEVFKNPKLVIEVFEDFCYNISEEIWRVFKIFLQLMNEICFMFRGLSSDISKLATTIYVSTSKTEAIVLGINIVFKIA